MAEVIDNQKERVYAGLAYAAFERLYIGDNEGARELLGNVTKRLLADAGVKGQPTSTELARLMEEALTYIQEHPVQMW